MCYLSQAQHRTARCWERRAYTNRQPSTVRLTRRRRQGKPSQGKPSQAKATKASCNRRKQSATAKANPPRPQSTSAAIHPRPRSTSPLPAGLADCTPSHLPTSAFSSHSWSRTAVSLSCSVLIVSLPFSARQTQAMISAEISSVRAVNALKNRCPGEPNLDVLCPIRGSAGGVNSLAKLDTQPTERRPCGPIIIY